MVIRLVELQQRILVVLGEVGSLAMDGLLEQVNARQAAGGLPEVTRRSLVDATLDLLRRGRVERTIRPHPEGTQYRLPSPPRYSCREGRGVLAGGWELCRADPGEGVVRVLGVMDEAEARRCVTALNEADTQGTRC